MGILLKSIHSFDRFHFTFEFMFNISKPNLFDCLSFDAITESLRLLFPDSDRAFGISISLISLFSLPLPLVSLPFSSPPYPLPSSYPILSPPPSVCFVILSPPFPLPSSSALSIRFLPLPGDLIPFPSSSIPFPFSPSFPITLPI